MHRGARTRGRRRGARRHGRSWGAPRVGVGRVVASRRADSRERAHHRGRASAHADLRGIFADTSGRGARSRAQGSRGRSRGGGHSRGLPGGGECRTGTGCACAARCNARGVRIAGLSRAARRAASAGRSCGA